MENFTPELIELLETEVHRINNIDFISKDPVQFPRRFNNIRDIEIVAFLSATIAWGNRKMICNNCEKMLKLMDYQPYNYISDCGYEDLGERFNIHRTFFSDDFTHFLKGLKLIYDNYGTINDFAKSKNISESETPSWLLADEMRKAFEEANGEPNSRCIPGNTDKTALKRINMALRWLVRTDGIVDMGVWDCVKPSQLFIPLDVHVGNTARKLGLLQRRSNDKLATILLTEQLRKFNPEDPVIYDYALFGLGISGKLNEE